MLMWYIILAITIILTGSGLIYVGNRVSKFGFAEKFSRGSRTRRNLIGAVVVLLVFFILSLTLNLMNAVICLLHFMVLWLLCDFVFYVAQKIRKQPFKRYYAGGTAIILSIFALAAGWYLDHHVWTTSYVIETDKVSKNLRIILFADSHIGTTFDSKGFAGLLEQMQQQKPDIVVIAGDFVDDGTKRAEMLAACQALGKLKTAYGVYFAFGNHDKGYYSPELRGFTGSELIAELEKNNVKVLQDETVLIGKDFYIIGRKDMSELQRGSSRAEMKELLNGLDKNKMTIVLDHQPGDYDNQTAAEVDLVLSGHTHGGQLFPLNKVGEWIGANDLTYGFEQRRKSRFIVTSGLSNWAMKFKTGTKSEFVIIDILKKQKEKQAD